MSPLVDDVWAQRWRDPRQRAWLRVSAYAEDRAGTNGHCPLTARELQRVLGLDGQQVSRAIALARSEGWLHPQSTARCLVRPGAATPARCPALHRDEAGAAETGGEGAARGATPTSERA